jgi:hypothetical protein
MTDKIPYVFVWTPKYKVFHDILQQSIKFYPNLLEDKSVFIPQEVWDANANKAPGHFMTGCSLKLQVAYKMLHELPNESYFIFSDADILIFPNKPLFEMLDLYKKLKADIVFMREHYDMRFSNVGFSFIKVNDVNRDLFKRAIAMFETEPNGLDGSNINECLKTYTGSHFWFPSELVATTCSLNQQDEIVHRQALMRSKLIVYQALCDADKSTASQIHQKLEQYQILGVPIKFEGPRPPL